MEVEMEVEVEVEMTSGSFSCTRTYLPNYTVSCNNFPPFSLSINTSMRKQDRVCLVEHTAYCILSKAERQ